PMDMAERLRRAQCLSRSGVAPSKARAPSNTLDASQKPCVRAPMIGALPSSQSPSRKVKVCDHADIDFLVHQTGSGVGRAVRTPLAGQASGDASSILAAAGNFRHLLEWLDLSL